MAESQSSAQSSAGEARERIRSLFIDGPRTGETEIVHLPPPDIYDCDVLVDDPREWEVRPGEPYGLARFESHRYRFVGYGTNDADERVALYQHVELIAA